jgi:hypothetical protein
MISEGRWNEREEERLTKTLILSILTFSSAKLLNETNSNVTYVTARYYRAPELLSGSEKYSK